MNRKAEKILVMGSKKVGLSSLETIRRVDPLSTIEVITLDDRADGRSMFDAIGKFCSEKGIRLYVATSRKHSEVLIRELAPDIAFVVGWYWLISSEILASVPLGFVGVHNSALPKYRGGSPLVWAMINGEPEVGVSLFSLSEGVDDGGIWSQKTIPLGDDDYVGDVMEKLETLTVEMLRENYPRIVSGRSAAVPQDLTASTFCAQRIPEDGLIRWQKPAREILNFIRAQSDPYPGAFTLHNGKPLKIWGAKIETIVYYGTPGQVACIDERGVHVICGDHRPLILGKVTYDEATMDARQAITSFKARLG